MDVTYLQRAALAGALLLPLAGVGAVVAQDDGDELVPCDGCGDCHPPSELEEGPLETRWCAACCAAKPPEVFDCVEEDDGEP